jgi:hypothetical protein
MNTSISMAPNAVFMLNANVCRAEFPNDLKSRIVMF